MNDLFKFAFSQVTEKYNYNVIIIIINLAADEDQFRYQHPLHSRQNY